jgi:hypothetical protein
MHPRPPVSGGRKKTLKTKKAKKGGYYGFAGDVAPGAANWTRHSEMGEFAMDRGGNAQYGRGRKRKATKKGGKKTRKVRRGGGKYGEVSASYQGTGSRGLANVVGISPNKPGFATEGEFNNYGAQPGSGFGSFITTSK